MFEKVNPSHPDKIADRIAGALVDLAYKEAENPKIAVEVLIGHGKCHIIAETSVKLNRDDVASAVQRIAGGDIEVDYQEVPQDEHLAKNQEESIRCGDNGIFKGVPVAEEEQGLAEFAESLYEKYPYDGKFVTTGNKLIICQSNVSKKDIMKFIVEDYNVDDGDEIIVNPLGEWTGGTDVDTGATNRKLGSDMAQSVTGGGLHGKDLSKADVSVNIFAFLVAQISGETVECHCAIGDTEIDGISYSSIVEFARQYIKGIGGFEKFAEWGLVR